MRKARGEARSNLPCAGCGFEGEPVLRKPRPYSAEWIRDRSTYFGCPTCGLSLARLFGPSAHRPADVPSDHLPDPAGLVEARIQPAVSRARPDARQEALESAAAEAARDHGLVCRSGDVVRLYWRGQPWLDLVLEEGRVLAH